MGTVTANQRRKFWSLWPRKPSIVNNVLYIPKYFQSTLKVLTTKMWCMPEVADANWWDHYAMYWNITLNLTDVNNYYVPIWNISSALPSQGDCVCSLSVCLCASPHWKTLNQNQDLQNGAFLNSSHGCAINMEMKREFNHVWLFGGRKANMWVC